MRRKARLAVAAACAAVAMLASGAYASAVRAEVEQERSETLERYGGEVTQLVVATRELDAGETVASSDVEVRDWLAEMAPEGSYLSIDDVVGCRLTSAVAEGMPLTETSVRTEESVIDVPAGQVATSVVISDHLGLADGVAAGERLLAYESDDGGTHLLSDSVTVLAVDDGQTTFSGNGTVTVAMSPSVVNELLRCASAGSLRLVVPADDVGADELSVYEAPTTVEAVGDLNGDDTQGGGAETGATEVEPGEQQDAEADGGSGDVE